ncbi:uncharacterized protein GGS25DRAFT_100765 [Hypoxylon fragiforme]|uniref:uncharacterized protein n=1 Tax=Hypoxylon fragiforme TaxID=63214 RepID=UPI0020C69547|nr:uncharacterized protein GGS25DRAFT_100765 [Hypoxylon fragiforme]KAI2603606.1 hypothetical protein GGS25DRAFT_100765 [Hypoxylon fragiforme]
MSTKDPSFSSNNPFRRKLGNFSSHGHSPAHSPAPTTASIFDGSLDSIPRPPPTTFRSASSEDDRRQEDEKHDIGRETTTNTGGTVPEQPRPKKVVKKVRVQSPPPSSPEDAVPIPRFPTVNDSDSDSDSDDDDDVDDDDEDDDDEYGDEYNSDSREYRQHAGPPGVGPSPTNSRDSNISDHTQPRLAPSANPFSKTVHVLEQTGQGQDANTFATSTTAKGALDVDSFKRLLLTGYANISGPSSIPALSTGGNAKALPHDGASNTDASSVSRQSIMDAISQETPRTSHEISETDDPEERRGIVPSSPLATPLPSTSTKKKPPPPNSRHGKLIKIELGADMDSRPSRNPTPPMPISAPSHSTLAPPRKSGIYPVAPGPAHSSTTDVNKPLPQAPFRPSGEEATDSPFDREAIGKAPEPFTNLQANARPPTPPAVTRGRSGSNGSTQARKPVAPPPRRHGRSDSRAPSINTTTVDDETPPRSSLDSNRSRTDSLRANTTPASNVGIPAPPPPRRPNHARQGSSYASPNQGSFTSLSATSPGISESERSPVGMGIRPVSSGGQTEGSTGLATFTTSKDGLPKLSPPPPPPARQASTRRPASVRSVDLGNGHSTARKVSKEKDGNAPPPPPPPPRQRGGSRASAETPASDAEGTKGVSDETQQEISTSTQAPATQQSTEILADLDALQREVDALMGRYGKPGGS